MRKQIHLPIYGTLDFHDDPLMWDLFQSEPIARLRDISLSSVPSRFTPHGMPASRFQHSVGVAHLARTLCQRQHAFRAWRGVLVAAGLCHDSGAPPFSHISESFFYHLTGYTHEQQTQRLLAPGGEIASLLAPHGADPQEVVDLVNGQHHPLGPLIAGSIDLDNIDNSLHLLVSYGYYDPLPYHPLRLIDGIGLTDGQLTLDSDLLSEFLGWKQAREKLYSVLQSEAHFSSATMLYRALEFAYAQGLLSEPFFELGESDALHFLRYQCDTTTQSLIEACLQWRQYPLVLLRRSVETDQRLVGLYEDWEARKRLTDQMAEEMGLAAHELALYVGRDKGEKNVTLPWRGRHAAAASQLFAGGQGEQMVAVFAHKRLLREDRDWATIRTAEVLDRAVAQLPEASGEPHVFF